jgi:hypothetical protein
MKATYSMFWLLLIPVIVALPSSSALAEDVPVKGNVSASAQTEKINLELDNPDWQTVLDSFFGTAETPDSGILDGSRNFKFRAEDLVLTTTQADLFTSPDYGQNLAALLEGAIALHGNIRLEGTIDGEPFELKLAGRELKIQGLTLTSAQRESLVAELSGVSGLKEIKIQALVDGKSTITKYQGGHEKIEVRSTGRPEHAGKPEKVEPRIETRERIERPARIEKPERPEPGLGRR